MRADLDVAYSIIDTHLDSIEKKRYFNIFVQCVLTWGLNLRYVPVTAVSGVMLHRENIFQNEGVQSGQYLDKDNH